VSMLKLESIAPIFAVRDLAEALAFYKDALGFELARVWGTPPDIAAVCRDNVEITLTSRPEAQPRAASSVYLRVSDVDSYCAQMVRAGARIVVPIGDRAYGMRDFRVADPSGNELNVGKAVADDRHA
jgi:uncharacterized glyoxalase superfamily protein PhnB